MAAVVISNSTTIGFVVAAAVLKPQYPSANQALASLLDPSTIMRARNLMGHLRWWRPGRAPTMIGSVGRKSPWSWLVLGRRVACLFVGEDDERQYVAFSLLPFSNLNLILFLRSILHTNPSYEIRVEGYASFPAKPNSTYRVRGSGCRRCRR